MFDHVYKGKKVLITGHTGFKGSWLALWLTQMGASVTGFSKYYPSDPCHFQALHLENDLTHVEGDICQYEVLKKVFDQYQPDVVFHLAAQPIVMNAYENPQLTFQTNLMGTVNVLECLRHSTSVKAAVMITSDKCYENVGWDWGYRETDRLGGADPYSASKACAEIAVSAYFRSFIKTHPSVKIVTARAGNVIGGGDWAPDRIVPDCIRAWTNNKTLEIRKPEATRPWLHVLEPISGYLWLGACLLNNPEKINGEAFNFGPDAEVVSTVQELVNEMMKYWPGAKCELFRSTSKEEAALLKLSFDKALRKLAWKPVLSFTQTVEMTAQWYRSFYFDHKDMKTNSLAQIAQYVELARLKKPGWMS
ncbi:MAG: CDP-glucose 4,6-dehydratase [Candidatus Omnitrophica bacterium]|nr:CDP-glucose 4,6-dehydratase [Candidatus Omnitrophota bacterium]